MWISFAWRVDHGGFGLGDAEREGDLAAEVDAAVRFFLQTGLFGLLAGGTRVEADQHRRCGRRGFFRQRFSQRFGAEGAQSRGAAARRFGGVAVVLEDRNLFFAGLGLFDVVGEQDASGWSGGFREGVFGPVATIAGVYVVGQRFGFFVP